MGALFTMLTPIRTSLMILIMLPVLTLSILTKAPSARLVSSSWSAAPISIRCSWVLAQIPISGPAPHPVPISTVCPITVLGVCIG